MTTNKQKSATFETECTIYYLDNNVVNFKFLKSTYLAYKLQIQPCVTFNPTKDPILSLIITNKINKQVSRNMKLNLTTPLNNPNLKEFSKNIQLDSYETQEIKIENLFPTKETLLNPNYGYLESKKITFAIKFSKTSKSKHSRTHSLTQPINSPNIGTTQKCGLHNYGCTCYMNSCLQIMYNIPFFRKELYSLNPDHKLFKESLLNTESKTLEKDEKTLERKTKWERKTNSIIKALQIVFAKMETIKLPFITPDELPRAFDWNAHNLLEQEDAHEFMRSTLSKLEDRQTEIFHFSECQATGKDFLNTVYSKTFKEGIKNIKQTELRYLTGGYSKVTLSNDKLNFKKENLEEFHDLPLNVTGFDNIYESLKNSLSPETLTGDNRIHTEKHGRIDVVRKTTLKQLGPILMLHLKRFNFDMNTGSFSKINSKFDFNKELDLNNFVEDEEIDYSYKLYGFIVHKGVRLDSGHYYSIINPELDDKWFAFNDEDVSECSSNLEPYFGDDRSPTSAYLLIYIRHDSTYKLFDKSINPLSYLNKKTMKQVNREKSNAEKSYINAVENGKGYFKNALLIFEDELFAKIVSSVNPANIPAEAWIICSYLIYGDDPFRRRITSNLGFDVPSVKMFMHFLKIMVNPVWAYHNVLKEQNKENPIAPLSSEESLALNRNILMLGFVNISNINSLVKETIFYLNAKVAFFKLKQDEYETEFDSNKLGIFLVSKKASGGKLTYLKMIYPFNNAKEMGMNVNRVCLYLCEINKSLIADGILNKRTLISVFIKEQAENDLEIGNYVNKGCFLVNKNWNVLKLQEELVKKEIIKTKNYKIKIELSDKLEEVDIGAELESLGNCFVLSFIYKEVEEYDKYHFVVTFTEIAKTYLKQQISLNSNEIVKDFIEFYFKKDVSLNEIKEEIKCLLNKEINLKRILIKGTEKESLEGYKQKIVLNLNKPKDKGLSSKGKEFLDGLEGNQAGELYSGDNPLRPRIKRDIDWGELEAWRIWEQTIDDQEAAANFKYYLESFRGRFPDYEVTVDIKTEDDKIEEDDI